MADKRVDRIKCGKVRPIVRLRPRGKKVNGRVGCWRIVTNDVVLSKSATTVRNVYVFTALDHLGSMKEYYLLFFLPGMNQGTELRWLFALYKGSTT